MALISLKCNRLTPLRFKGLKKFVSVTLRHWIVTARVTWLFSVHWSVWLHSL